MLSKLMRGHTRRPDAACPVCGSSAIEHRPVLWQELVDAWGLSEEEVLYIDRQQGQYCQNCQCNLRSRTLAAALLDYFDYHGTLLEFCRTSRQARKASVLELNEAGGLSPWLTKLSRHTLARYPEVDMQALPYASESWNLILHSDVLEHIPDPSIALQECHRVLARGGALIYTIPLIYGRLSRIRHGLPMSYHGTPGQEIPGWQVHTEYGADFWLQPISAGFRKIALYTLSGPESLAIVCTK
jgi:SAM-dependent methyltransferase